MKCTIFILSLFFISFSTSAQFQKGNKVLGFGFGLSASSGESQNTQFPQTNKSNSLNASVELGFATKENRLHGFYLGGGYSENKNESNGSFPTDSKSSSQSYGFGYFTRMYKSLGKGFYVFGDVRGGYNYADYKNRTNNTEDKRITNSVSASFFPGVTYKWNNRFLLEVRTGDFVSIGYNNSTTKNNVNNEKFVSNNFSVNSSLGLGFLQNFGIGARWILR